MPSREGEVARALCTRLANSSGGTFLITGFRGVGKTTAVQRALGQLADTTGRQVIDVTVSVARPVETLTLLFEVIRRLVERLQEEGVIERLTPDVREAVHMAYARTSMAYKESTSQSDERVRGGSVGGRTGFGKGGPSIPFPRWTWNRTRSKEYATELSFLAYADTDAEHDLLRIVELLRRDDAIRTGPLRRALAWTGLTGRAQPLDASVVVVFDEIDKLTQPEDGREAFDALLSGLKNLLGAGGVHFIVVAGVDLHDEWLRETATANSLYRSVFAWQCYTPCSWGVAAPYMREIAVGASDAERDAVARYVEFQGRGILRSLIHELNDLVDWDADGPHITLEGATRDRVELFSELTQVVERTMDGAPEGLLATPSDRDRTRQAAYYVVDWVLRSGEDSFTVADVLDEHLARRIDPVLRPSETAVTEMLDALAANGTLDRHIPRAEVITQPSEERVSTPVYRLSPTMGQRLSRIAQASPRTRAEIGQSPTPSVSRGTGVGMPRLLVQQLVGDRYEVRGQLARGGFSTVWRAFDLDTMQDVAIKVTPIETPSQHRRLRREVELLEDISHPGIVPLLDSFTNRRLHATVTPLIDGPRLDQLTSGSPSQAVTIVIGVLEGLAALHEAGLVHADVKPANVMLHRDGRPVLVDFGTVLTRQEPERADDVFGTPAYMAPERLTGHRPTISSDVYSAGVVLLELLGGRSTETLALGSTQMSPPLREVVRRAMAPNPADRFASAEEMAAALEAVPEARQAHP